METDCVFCDKEKIREDILYQTDNFFVKVGFDIISPGHVMLISDMHLKCYGELPDYLDQEYIESKQMLDEEIAKHFAKPFRLEAGVYGQSVFHAHTHFIPLKGPGYSIESLIEEMVISGNIRYEEADMARLKQIYREEGEYVSIEEKGKLYVCHIDGRIYDPQNRDPNLNVREFIARIPEFPRSSPLGKNPEDKRRDDEYRDLTKKLLFH
jgi:diadenosine tetraphosphate (Ap4A) HIT family hydrolase